MIDYIFSELTIPKLVAGFIAYGIIHAAWSILRHLEKRAEKQAIAMLRHRHVITRCQTSQLEVHAE